MIFQSLVPSSSVSTTVFDEPVGGVIIQSIVVRLFPMSFGSPNLVLLLKALSDPARASHVCWSLSAL